MGEINNHTESTVLKDHLYKPQEVFYGIYLSPDARSVHIKRENLILTDKSEAVKLVKKYKGARFKRFSSFDEAYEFVLNGSDNSCSNDTSPVVMPMEKLIPHKAPRPQDLVKLRKSIEAGDIVVVKKMIEDNPRYLISSGDTPSILQEGPRYNALHCAARACNAVISSYILETVSSVDFLMRLYGFSGTDVPDNLHERCTFLVDLFLNTPDKSLNETPLHFASKLGAVDVIVVLLSYPQCKRRQQNKYNQTPLDIVCTRVSNDDINNKKKIIMLITDSYYVPVLRSDDISLQAKIGGPFTVQNSQSSIYNSPESKDDSFNVTYAVKAVAGPMDENTAINFRKQWKIQCKLYDNQKKVLIDTDKGLEIIGRKLASEYDVQWTEYWSFLDIFVDIRSNHGLFLLEEFLKKRFRQAVISTASSGDYLEDTSPFCADDLLNITPAQLSTPIWKKNRKFNNSCHSKPNRNYKSPSENIVPTNPFIQVERMCQEFARRLNRTILCCSRKGINNEIAHIQNYISSCADDFRFKCVELNKIHCRLARACVIKLKDATERQKAYNAVETILGQHRHSTTPKSSYIPLYCVGNFLLEFLIKEPLEEDLKNSDSDRWTFEQDCSCEIPVYHKSIISRRILFSQSDDEDNAALDDNHLFGDYATSQIVKEVSDESSGDESDISDPELECYYTPPTSPGLYDDSNDSDESELITPDEGPDIFIMGDKPTKVDAAVLDALSSVSINCLKYPHIFRWKHLCTFTGKLPAENWPTPTSQPILALRKRQEDLTSFTPPWHPSKLLLYHHRKN